MTACGIIEAAECDDKTYEIMEKVSSNMQRGSKTPYKPLPREESLIARGFFAKQMVISLQGNQHSKFRNKSGTLIATGYSRVVVGDYGPYVEFTKDQVNLDAIKSRWPGKPSRLVKYIWMESGDSDRTKVYHQQNEVPYADYKVGMFYVSPWDLFSS